jgi:hypothetical protein
VVLTVWTGAQYLFEGRRMAVAGTAPLRRPDRRGLA